MSKQVAMKPQRVLKNTKKQTKILATLFTMLPEFIFLHNPRKINAKKSYQAHKVLTKPNQSV